MRPLLLTLALLPAALSAQSVFFHFTDGIESATIC
jgi:hypothetical protein